MQVDDTADTGLEVALNAVGRALKAGRLDEAADKLGSIRSRGEREGRLNQTLAGRFLQAERFEDAIPFAQHAWLCEPENIDRAKLFAWALAKAGLLEACAKVLRWTIARAPDRIDLKRELLSRLVQSSQFDEATMVAAEISQAEPDNPDRLFGMANVLRQAGRNEEATSALRNWLKSESVTETDGLRLLSYLITHATLGEAAEVAAEIAERWPHSAEAHKRAYTLLGRSGKSKDAVKFARAAVELNSNDAGAHRALSALLVELKYFSEAFQHAHHATKIEPNNVAYRIFLANHYRRFNRLGDALAELSFALMIDPQNRKALADFVDLLKIRGQWPQAELVRRRGHELYPDDPVFAKSIEFAEATSPEDNEVASLNDGHDLINLRLRSKRRRDRLDRPVDRVVSAATTQVRVIWALLLREVHTRYGKTQLGFLWAFLEPLLHLTLLGISMAMFRGVRAPLGHHFIIFHFSAIIPYLTMIHTGSHVGAARKQMVVLQLPMVQLNDIFLARAILELLIGIVVSVVLLFGFYLAGYDWMPFDPLGMLVALFWTWLLGLGLGMINAMIGTQFEAWDMVWHTICRTLYFISGVFYLPTMLPHMYLQYLIWNPMLHAIDWNRSMFYNDYHPVLTSPNYVIGWAVATIFLGLTLERALRRSALVYQQ